MPLRITPNSPQANQTQSTSPPPSDTPKQHHSLLCRQLWWQRLAPQDGAKQLGAKQLAGRGKGGVQHSAAADQENDVDDRKHSRAKVLGNSSRLATQHAGVDVTRDTDVTHMSQRRHTNVIQMSHTCHARKQGHGQSAAGLRQGSKGKAAGGRVR